MDHIIGITMSDNFQVNNINEKYFVVTSRANNCKLINWPTINYYEFTSIIYGSSAQDERKRPS